MAAWVCLACGTVYAVEAPGCPQCGSTEWMEQGAEMAKITKHGGVSDVAAEPALVDEDQAELGLDGADEVYDPADYTVAEVNAYLDQCRADGNLEEAARVQEAEQAGRNRAGIVSRV